MILNIVLLILLILVLSFLILFTFLVLFPSLSMKTSENFDESLKSYSDRNYIVPEKKDFEITDKKAIVLCSCHKTFINPQNNFNEVHSCFMIKSLQDSGADCKYACIGLGDCAKVCSQEAISIVNNTALITDLCCGCGKCVNVCPQKIITLIPKDTKSIVLCSNQNVEELTSCSELRKTTNVGWNVKKDFKIWSYCYRIFNRLRDFLLKR